MKKFMLSALLFVLIITCSTAFAEVYDSSYRAGLNLSVVRETYSYADQSRDRSGFMVGPAVYFDFNERHTVFLEFLTGSLEASDGGEATDKTKIDIFYYKSLERYDASAANVAWGAGWRLCSSSPDAEFDWSHAQFPKSGSVGLGGPVIYFSVDNVLEQPEGLSWYGELIWMFADFQEDYYDGGDHFEIEAGARYDADRFAYTVGINYLNYYSTDSSLASSGIALGGVYSF